MPANSFAASIIENIADISYQDAQGLEYTLRSNKKSTQINAIRGVALTTTQPELTGNKFGKWIFPLDLTNKGKETDTYRFEVDNLPNGISYKFYEDTNNNGILEDDEPEIQLSPEMDPEAVYKLFIVFQDNAGIFDGIDPTVTAISSTQGTAISSSVVLKVITEITPVPTPNPTPTPEEDNKQPEVFLDDDLELRKEVYPASKVKAGDILTYQLKVSNKGQTIVNRIAVIDRIPDHLILLEDDVSSVVASNDGEITYSDNGNDWKEEYKISKYVRVSWSHINPYDSYTVSFRVRVGDTVEENTPIENRAWLNYQFKINDAVTGERVIDDRIFSNITTNVVDNDYSIAGTVIDKKTGLPKENVKVTVLDKDGNVVRTEITGKTGKYNISVNEKGEYTVVFTDENGIVITSKSTQVTAPGVNYNPIEISGKVKDSQTDKPVANAKLEMLDADKNVILTLTTDAEGNYLITQDGSGKPIKPGNYILRVTQADGHITYVRVNVTVGPGDIIVNLDILVDPFGVVYDAIGGLDIRIQGAEVRLQHDCDNPESLVQLEDLAVDMKQENPVITTEKGTYQYFMTTSQLTNKRYCLLVSAEGYKSRKFIVNTRYSSKFPNKYALDIYDEDGKHTAIENVESIPFNIPLQPLKIIDLKKRANKNTIEIGDVVTYTLEATNKLKFYLSKGRIVDNLPFGFKYVEGTLRVNGKKVEDFTAVDELNIELGELIPEKPVTIMYQARTGIRVGGDASINEAQAFATVPADITTRTFSTKAEGMVGQEVASEIARATVFVRKGVFRRNGTIIGRVYIDSNNNGIYDETDKSVENIALYTANGLRVISDAKGKFSIPDIPFGDFLVHLDKTSLPSNLYVVEDAISVVKATNKKIVQLAAKEIEFGKKYSEPLLVTDNDSLSVKYELKKNEKLVIVLPGKEIDNGSSNKVAINSLGLGRELNKVKFKIIDDKGHTIKENKGYLYFLPQLEPPAKEQWIGEDDILRRVFVPESGLAKVNFRLVELAPIVLNLKPVDDKKSPLMAMYVYPSKIAVKEIPLVTYPDIKGHWVQKLVEYESGLEIIHGYPDGNFKPAREITRSEATKLVLVASKSFDVEEGSSLGFVLQNDSKVDINIFDSENEVVRTIYKQQDKKAGFNLLFWNARDESGKLVKTGNYKLEIKATDADNVTNTLTTTIEMVPPVPNYHPKGKAAFKDVKDSHWANPFIKEGTEGGLVKGYPDGTFKPDNTILRHEMAVIGVKVLNLNLAEAKEELPYKDAAGIPKWARKYVYLAHKYKLLPEFPDNTFRPEKSITRAEVAVFVKQLIQYQSLEKTLKGSVSEDLETVTVEGKNITVKDKAFEIQLEKENLKEVEIKVPGLETEEITEDENFKFIKKKRF